MNHVGKLSHLNELKYLIKKSKDLNSKSIFIFKFQIHEIEDQNLRM